MKRTICFVMALLFVCLLACDCFAAKKHTHSWGPRKWYSDGVKDVPFTVIGGCKNCDRTHYHYKSVIYTCYVRKCSCGEVKYETVEQVDAGAGYWCQFSS